MVAARLRGCVRETDTISRVGGDEFFIIQTGIGDATDAERLARRIVEVDPGALRSCTAIWS